MTFQTEKPQMNSSSITTQPVEPAQQVTELFRNAFIFSELPPKMCRAPAVNPDALNSLGDVARACTELSGRAAHVILRALYIPPASRRRQVLQALAAFLPDAPSSVCCCEQWFSRQTVCELASAAGCTPAEAAGWLALQALKG
jgi:hypothetical protein